MKVPIAQIKIDDLDDLLLLAPVQKTVTIVPFS